MMRRIVLLLTVTALMVASVGAPASAQQGQTGPTGDLSVVGEVTVNGPTTGSLEAGYDFTFTVAL
jgi:hypothetical protein